MVRVQAVDPQHLINRMQRQRVLYEGDHTFAIVVEEAVLHAGTGGVETMTEQLEHLLTIGSLPSTRLRYRTATYSWPSVLTGGIC